MLAAIAGLLPVFAWILISVLFNAFGEFASKTWANSPTWWELALVVGAYALSGLFWLPALYLHNNLALLGTLWFVVAIVLTVLIGTLFFHEQLTITQWFGIGFALVAILLLTH